jgi:MoxR-like ATPase
MSISASGATGDEVGKRSVGVAVAALTAHDAPRAGLDTHQLMSRRVLTGGVVAYEPTGLAIAKHGLEVIAQAMAEAGYVTASGVELAQKIKARHDGTQDNDPETRVLDRVIMSLIGASAPPAPTVREIRTLGNQLPHQPSATTQPSLLPSRDVEQASGPVADTGQSGNSTEASPGPAPWAEDADEHEGPVFDADAVNYRRFAGSEVMLESATGGAFKTHREVFTTLQNAQRRAARYRDLLANGGAMAPRDPATANWTSRETTLGAVIPASAIVLGGGSAIDVAKLLALRVRVWSADRQTPWTAQVNPAYRFDAEFVATMLSAIDTGANTFLSGPTGCGKTTGCENLAARLGMPFVRVAVDGEMRRREIIGGLMQEATETGSRTVWRDGRLPIAYGMPSMLLLDEFDHADPDLAYSAHEALERKTMTIAEQPNRSITMHPGCTIVATGNTRGGGDSAGRYAVRQPMSEATRNRFSLWVACTYLSATAEGELLQSRVPRLARGTVTKLCAVAADLRASLERDEIRTACSTRDVLAIGADVAWRSAIEDGTEEARLRRALERAIVGKAVDEHDIAAVRGIVQNRLGNP